MGEFDLDLQAAESEIDEPPSGDRVVLGFLDGETPPEEWVEEVADGSVLVLRVDGDLHALAAGFAREIKEMDGELMHFREFLIVSPPGTDIDAGRV